MKNFEEKEKKLGNVLNKLNKLTNTVVKMNNDINTLNLEKNQLLSEKEESEQNFQKLSKQHQELKFELDKIIYDERTSPIGVNGHSTGIEQTENGDIYSFSTSALSAGFTLATKPSGILRIKNGETEFDQDYFFNVEEATNGGSLGNSRR